MSALLACNAGAQTTAAPAEQAPKAAIEQKAESITHEDAGSRIEELRVGGETRQIEVQTKTALPPTRSSRPTRTAMATPAAAAGA